MCECGCTMNDERFLLPAPDGELYVVTLAGHCSDCDSPSGITIELIEKNNPMFREYKRGDFTIGYAKFVKWPDSKGISIPCGLTKGEFVKAAKQHLVGESVSDMADENGVLDDIAAETILEEMYSDVQLRPVLHLDYGGLT